MRRVLAVLAAWCVLSAICAEVRADGFFAPKIAIRTMSEPMIRSPRQEALLQVARGTVTVTLRTYFNKGPEEMAWVVPVPSEPVDIREGDSRVFWRLERDTAPAFSTGGGHGGLGCSCGGVVSDDLAGGVAVRKSGTAGIFEWKVIEADDSAKLTQWLTTNKYAVPVGAERVLAHYVGRRWWWLAMKVRADVGDQWTLAPHPIVYSYKADRLVYPLVISQLSADLENEIVLYVQADRRYACVNWSNRTITEGEIAEDHDSPSGSTYEAVLRKETLRALGHLFVTEYARNIARELPWLYREICKLDPEVVQPAMPYLTRLRALMTARAMDRDVELGPVDAGEVKNWYQLESHRSDGQPSGVAVASVGLVAVFASRSLVSRRRRRATKVAGMTLVIAACLTLAML
jgi:hypothetical protein